MDEIIFKSKIIIARIILLINILLIFLNIYFLIKKKNIMHIKKQLDEKIILKFKISDSFILNMMNKKYQDISDFLNNKYKETNIASLKKRVFLLLNNFLFYRKRKKIILYSVDLFSISFHKKWLKDKLKGKFIMEFNKNNPDYLIYNVFGNEHLNPKYNKAIKIAIFTENKIPDFNEADYIIGHYHINYFDRYFKYSIFLWQNLDNNYFNSIRKEILKNPKRQKFCSALISNYYSTDGFRINFINELNKYKTIDMGGKFNNNVGGPVKDKIKFLNLYKFSIAMENSEGDGYLSEKIVHSFLAGNIPIYYGDYMIDEYINIKSFILIKGEKDVPEKIKYIKKIDNDNNLYKSILKENIITDNNAQNKIDKELKEFLQNIFYQDKTKAIRKFF